MFPNEIIVYSEIAKVIFSFLLYTNIGQIKQSHLFFWNEIAFLSFILLITHMSLAALLISPHVVRNAST